MSTAEYEELAEVLGADLTRRSLSGGGMLVQGTEETLAEIEASAATPNMADALRNAFESIDLGRRRSSLPVVDGDKTDIALTLIEFADFVGLHKRLTQRTAAAMTAAVAEFYALASLERREGGGSATTLNPPVAAQDAVVEAKALYGRRGGAVDGVGKTIARAYARAIELAAIKTYFGSTPEFATYVEGSSDPAFQMAARALAQPDNESRCIPQRSKRIVGFQNNPGTIDFR